MRQLPVQFGAVGCKPLQIGAVRVAPTAKNALQVPDVVTRLSLGTMIREPYWWDAATSAMPSGRCWTGR